MLRALVWKMRIFERKSTVEQIIHFEPYIYEAIKNVYLFHLQSYVSFKHYGKFQFAMSLRIKMRLFKRKSAVVLNSQITVNSDSPSMKLFASSE